MPRPASTCSVVIDGFTYKTSKQQVSEYLLRRLSGATHKDALTAFDSSVVSMPMFVIAADEKPAGLANALRILTTPPSAPAPPPKK
jgi:hypothetical protein